MKREEYRNQKMAAAGELRIVKLEAQIEVIRGRLVKENEILAKHEIALSRKEAKGQDTDEAQKKVDHKRKEIELFRSRLEELPIMIEILREEMKRLMEFQPVQQTLENLPEGFRRAGKGGWNIPNSRFKTFQDIFTPPEARVVPISNRRLTSNDYDGLSLDACPLDPERVPKWFMKELGLGNLDGLSALEKLEQKAAAAPAIRDLFSHMVPMSAYGQKTHRLLVVQEYAEEHDGKILAPSYLGRENEEQDRKIMQVYGSIYEARRRSAYIDGGYVKEQEKLHSIRGQVNSINKELKGLREDDPRRAELQQELTGQIEVLGNVTNFYKARVADILGDVMEFKDRLGRHNPGAVCARLVKALDLLDKRLPQIFEKSLFMGDDKRMLDEKISQGKEIMDGNFRGFLALCRGLQQDENGGKVTRILDQLPEMDELVARPFNLYAAKLKAKTDAIRSALQAGDKEALRDQAINAYVACKVFQIQHQRERVLRDIAESPIQTTIIGLLAWTKDLNNMAVSKQTFPELRTGANEAYAEMTARLKATAQRLEIYARRKMTESERLAMYERLKKYLEDINFTDILEKL